MIDEKSKPSKKPKTAKKKAIQKATIISDLIVCEDIRQEVRGKMTLMGVYNDSILVSEWPADQGIALNIAFLVRFKAADKDATFTVKLIGASNKKELFVMDGETAAAGNSSGGMASIAVKGSGPLMFSEPGCYTFQLEYEGKKDSRDFWIKVDPSMEMP